MKRTDYKRLLLVFLALFLIVFWTLENVVAQSKICVCHLEDEKTGKGHVLEVDENSLQGHLKHGDIQCVDCSHQGDVCNISTGNACEAK